MYLSLVSCWQTREGAHHPPQVLNTCPPALGFCCRPGGRQGAQQQQPPPSAANGFDFLAARPNTAPGINSAYQST